MIRTGTAHCTRPPHAWRPHDAPRRRKPRAVLDTVKDAYGAAARRGATRSLTVPAPGALRCCWSGRRNGSHSNKKLTVEFGARPIIARQRPELAGGDGVIDRSSTRDIPTLATAVNAASLLGARVADTSSAASHIRAPKPYIWAQAIRITPDQIHLQAGGRPHMREA